MKLFKRTNNSDLKVELFEKEFSEFSRLASKTEMRFSLDEKDFYPCLNDKTNKTSFDTHYVYHTAWATRIIAKNNPFEHVDISSHLYFSSLLSAFIPVRFFDFRPPNIILSNLEVKHADLFNLFFETGSIKSLSCMHVVEHIGLGRYGDPLDYNGDLKAIKELKRVLKPGGDLLFVVPVGKPRILFNAHRIYDYEQIINHFSELRLVEFSLVPDNGYEVGIQKNATKEMADEQSYGCGCFWFRKE